MAADSTHTATPDEATSLVALRMHPVHDGPTQLRVEAVALAIQAIDKPRWGTNDKDKTGPQFDAELIATARVIHDFLTERQDPRAVAP